jgi:hypothetical protein
MAAKYKTRALTADEAKALDDFSNDAYKKFKGRFEEFEVALEQYRQENSLVCFAGGERKLVD